jgi:hypothetical protein
MEGGLRLLADHRSHIAYRRLTQSLSPWLPACLPWRIYHCKIMHSDIYVLTNGTFFLAQHGPSIALLLIRPEVPLEIDGTFPKGASKERDTEILRVGRHRHVVSRDCSLCDMSTIGESTDRRGVVW